MLDPRAVPVIPTSPDASFQSVAVVQGPAAGRSPGRELDRELGEVGLSKAVVRDGTRGRVSSASSTAALAVVRTVRRRRGVVAVFGCG